MNPAFHATSAVWGAAAGALIACYKLAGSSAPAVPVGPHCHCHCEQGIPEAAGGPLGFSGAVVVGLLGLCAGAALGVYGAFALLPPRGPAGAQPARLEAAPAPLHGQELAQHPQRPPLRLAGWSRT